MSAGTPSTPMIEMERVSNWFGAFQALENTAEMVEDAAQSIFNGTSPKFPRRDLTKRGRDVLRRAHTVANKVEELMMASMTAMDAAHLATVLSRCTEDLSAADEN